MGMKIINGVSKTQQEKIMSKKADESQQQALAALSLQVAMLQAQLAAKTTTTTDGGEK